MAKFSWKGKRKRRTREHIAEMSVNCLERQVLRRGHQLLRMPQPEYGVDAIMLHFAKTGEVEDGQLFFQLKATDSLKFVDKGRSIPVTVEVAHLNHWYWVKHHPVILVIYDAKKSRAFWLDVQAYVDEHELNPTTKSVTLRIPRNNTLSVRAIDAFRVLSLIKM